MKTKMHKLIAIISLALWSGSLIAQTDPRWLAGETISRPTGDSRITEIHYLRWGNNGDNIVQGPTCPVGRVWLIKAAGIATNDGDFLEWMLQLNVHNPFGTGGLWAVPLFRQPGFAMGTPVLAMNGASVIVQAGESISARSLGVSSDRQMALLYVGWEFEEKMLPYLLGLPRSDSSMSAEELAIEQLRASKGF